MIRLKRKPVPHLLPSISPQSWKTEGPGSTAIPRHNEHPETGFHQFPQSWRKPDGRGRSPGSRRTQFRSGIEWNGNRGGRLPRPFREMYRKYLAKTNPRTGRTYAEDIVENIINIAISGRPNSVRAAIAICETIDRQGFRIIYNQLNG
jgi:hypothetical protein